MSRLGTSMRTKLGQSASSAVSRSHLSASHSMIVPGEHKTGTEPSMAAAAGDATASTAHATPTAATPEPKLDVTRMNAIIARSQRCSLHGVAAAGHACGEGPGEIRLELRALALVGLLLGRDLPLLVAPAHAADQRPGRGPDGGACPRLARDGSAHRPDRSAARTPAHEAALGRRRGGGRPLRHHGVVPGLLRGPGLAFTLIPRLLLRALSALGIHKHLLPPGQAGGHHSEHAQAAESRASATPPTHLFTSRTAGARSIDGMLPVQFGARSGAERIGLRGDGENSRATPPDRRSAPHGPIVHDAARRAARGSGRRPEELMRDRARPASGQCELRPGSTRTPLTGTMRADARPTCTWGPVDAPGMIPRKARNGMCCRSRYAMIARPSGLSGWTATSRARR